jgi:hypothetical protein
MVESIRIAPDPHVSAASQASPASTAAADRCATRTARIMLTVGRRLWCEPDRVARRRHHRIAPFPRTRCSTPRSASSADVMFVPGGRPPRRRRAGPASGHERGQLADAARVVGSALFARRPRARSDLFARMTSRGSRSGMLRLSPSERDKRPGPGPPMRRLTRRFECGRYWDRTSDLFGVNQPGAVSSGMPDRTMSV